MSHVESLESRQLLAVTVVIAEIPISPAAVASDPLLAGHHTFDLRATFDGSPFNVAGFTAQLTRGEFYRPMGSTAAPAPAAVMAALPHLEYATFVCLPGLVPAPLGVWPFQENHPVLTADRFHPMWGAHGVSGPPTGTYTIARLTVPAGADGWIEGLISTRDSATTFHPFMDSLPPGRPVALIRSTVPPLLQSADHVGENLYYWKAYADLNENGLLDHGEPWDWTNNGFDIVVPAGKATVRMHLPEGYVPHPTLPSAHTVSLAAGERATVGQLALSAVTPGRILGRFHAVDGFDGATTTATYAANLAIYLDRNENGVQDLEEPLSTNIGINFRNLPPRSYTMRALPLGQWRPAPGWPAAQTFVIQPNQDITDAVVVATDRSTVSGRVSFTVDTAFRSPMGGTRVFDDVNENGTLDAGEPSALVDFDGRFTVYAVRPGRMALRVAPPGGFAPAAGTQGVHVVDLPSQGTDFAGRDFVLAPVAGRAGLPAAPPETVASRARVGDLLVIQDEVI